MVANNKTAQIKYISSYIEIPSRFSSNLAPCANEDRRSLDTATMRNLPWVWSRHFCPSHFRDFGTHPLFTRRERREICMHVVLWSIIRYCRLSYYQVSHNTQREKILARRRNENPSSKPTRLPLTGSKLQKARESGAYGVSKRGGETGRIRWFGVKGNKIGEGGQDGGREHIRRTV